MNGSSILGVALACVLTVAAADRKPAAGTYSVVAGTVFRDPGFALPDASVSLTLRNDPKAKKLQQAVTTSRGEFSFRVAPQPAIYVVKATMKGFHPDQKDASVAGGDHVEVTLTLVPESK